MPQFFIDRQLDVGSTVDIRGSDAKHISMVLRLGGGDWLLLSDGRGKNYRSEIVRATARSVIAHIVELVKIRVNEHPPVIAQAIIKHDRIEGIIQKAVELGARELIPFLSDRTIPRLAGGVTDARLIRWQRIALEAAKQSGLPFIPTISPPHTFDELMARAASFTTKLIFWEGERSRDLKSIRNELTIAERLIAIIGPEGGFTPDEIERARSAGAITVSLGPQILRVETACLAALTICQYESGGFSAPD